MQVEDASKVDTEEQRGLGGNNPGVVGGAVQYQQQQHGSVVHGTRVPVGSYPGAVKLHFLLAVNMSIAWNLFERSRF